jgi:hypothetical protein
MNFQLQTEQMSGYLAARFVGVAVAGEGSRHYVAIAEHCKCTKNDKLLIDITGFEVIKPNITNKFYAGERMLVFARYGIKVAFVCRPEQLETIKFAAMVAQNRSVTVEVFTDFQVAEEWLMNCPASQKP